MAYIDGARRITWAELDERTNRLAQLLRALGVQQGDRVASISTDCIELVEVVVACAKLGAVRVGVNHRYSASEVEHILNDSGTKVLLAEAEIADKAVEAVKHLPHMHLVGFDGPHPFETDYERSLEQQPATDPKVPVAYHDLGYLFYSSGSTGRPKGVAFTFRHVMDSLVQVSLNEGSNRSDTWLHTMPAGGIPLLILMRNTYHGSRCVIMRRWDAGEALALIQQERVTRTLLVPTMLISLLHHPDLRRYDLSSLRHIAYGSADGRPVTNLAAERLVRMGISLVPEGRQVFGPLTVRQNLCLGGFHRSPWQTRSLEDGLRRVFTLFPQLERLEDRAAGALSGGEQQMLAIGRALMASPRYLLLDEASLGLAPLVVRKILDTLQLLRSELNLGVLLVEQNARAALRIADHVVVLEGGRVALAGHPDEVGRSAAMQDAYLGRGAS